MLVLPLSNKRPISSKKDASSSSSSSMLCPAKGINEVEGTLTSISSAAEVVVFSSVSSAVYTYMPVYACTSNSVVALPRRHAIAVNCPQELINGESGKKRETDKILQN